MSQLEDMKQGLLEQRSGWARGEMLREEAWARHADTDGAREGHLKAAARARAEHEAIEAALREDVLRYPWEVMS